MYALLPCWLSRALKEENEPLLNPTPLIAGLNSKFILDLRSVLLR